MPTDFRNTASARKWPTRRWATIALNNNITDVASLTTYINGLIPDGNPGPGTRTVLIEIIRCLMEKEEGGEPGA